MVQRRLDTEAALRLLRRLLHNQPMKPETITTDGLALYGAALDVLDLRHLPAGSAALKQCGGGQRGSTTGFTFQSLTQSNQVQGAY